MMRLPSPGEAGTQSCCGPATRVVSSRSNASSLLVGCGAAQAASAESKASVRIGLIG
jgi:hypothetical protein